MVFGAPDLNSSTDDEVMNEINITPMVDIMLVLVIIFIITIPVMKHSVNIDLPRATSEARLSMPKNIRHSVNAQGTYFIKDA